MASLSTEKVRILETPGITSVYHEMKVNGFHLVEQKLINSKTSDCTPKMAIITHSRFIDDVSSKEFCNRGRGLSAAIEETASHSSITNFLGE